MKNLEHRLSQYRRVLEPYPSLFQVAESLYAKQTESNDGRHEVKNRPDGTLNNAIYVMAPVMYSFIRWVLCNASEAGYKRLYFLARDGYPMYETALIIKEKFSLPLELRYLHCSRYALRTAWYHLKPEESFKYIFLGGTFVTFEKVMQRAVIPAEKATQFAIKLGYFRDYDTKALTYDELGVLREKLKADPEFASLVKENSNNNYPLVTGYLTQEGLFDKIPYALVDSGWVGSMQKVLTDLVNKPLAGYYFGLYDYPAAMDKSGYHTYYFSPYGSIRRKVYFSNSLFECIFSSAEGMTVGYTKDKMGKYTPVLEQAENPNKTRINKTSAILREYVSLLEAGAETLSMKSTFRLLSLMMGKPTLEEAEKFGSYVFYDDVIGEDKQTVATILSKQDIRDNRLLNRLIRKCKGKQKIRESAWLQGSVVLVLTKPAKELRHVHIYRYVLYTWKQIKTLLGDRF